VTIEGIKGQFASLQQWHCRNTKKTLSVTEECRGLQPSIDTCYLTMRDKAACHYLHFSENINIVAQCFNYAKHVFPMSSLVHNLKAIQVANVLGVATNGSTAKPATFKQREAGAQVGICNAITTLQVFFLLRYTRRARERLCTSST
jgi:hypothetical protein